MRQMAMGDLGTSYRYDSPAWQIIKPMIPVTIELAALIHLISIVLGVPAGCHQRRAPGHDARLRAARVSLAGLSMPFFLAGDVSSW